MTSNATSNQYTDWTVHPQHLNLINLLFGNFLKRFPSEVLRAIANFCDFRSLARFARVSHKANSVVESLLHRDVVEALLRSTIDDLQQCETFEEMTGNSILMFQDWTYEQARESLLGNKCLECGKDASNLNIADGTRTCIHCFWKGSKQGRFWRDPVIAESFGFNLIGYATVHDPSHISPIVTRLREGETGKQWIRTSEVIQGTEKELWDPRNPNTVSAENPTLQRPSRLSGALAGLSTLEAEDILESMSFSDSSDFSDISDFSDASDL